MENVYSALKVFHFPDKLEEIGRGAVTPPLHVRLKPINACNHSCSWCCYRSEDLFLSQRFKHKDMIPREKMLEIVDDMAAAGVRAVTFTGGGEPLIYPYFVETTERLLQRGIKVAVLTNGSRLSGDVAAVLKGGASWVRVSIDATDGKTLAASRSVPATEYTTILQNIRDFAAGKRSDCELGINFIVTRENACSTFEFIRQMKQAGADHVKISECVISTKATENNLYHAEHFDLVRQQIARAIERLDDASFRVVDKFHDLDDKFDKTYETCPFLRYLNVIGADQKVYTCQDKAYSEEGLLGSVEDRSLQDLWQSQEYADRVRAVNPAQHCRHHCVQHGKNEAMLGYLTTDRRHLEFV